MKLNLDVFNGVKINETYPDGTVKSCVTTEYNHIYSGVGILVPQFTEEFSQLERRKKTRPSIGFYKDGTLKSVALEEQLDVRTPLGVYPAELVTFYDDGSLNRVFPLNSVIDGYWSEEEEGSLAESYTFDLPFGQVTTKIVSIRFDRKGSMKSLTFWPGSQVSLTSPLGEMACRVGFALYPDGALKSMEPANPTVITTPVGKVLAYDPDALGIHADTGSLGFYQDGSLRSFTTAVSTFDIKDTKGKTTHVGPREIESYTGEEDTTIVPVKVTFKDDWIYLDNGESYSFDLREIDVKIGISPLSMSGCTDCSSCNGCG